MIEIPIKLFKVKNKTPHSHSLTHKHKYIDINKNETINGQPISLHNEINKHIYYGHFISYA